MKGLKSASHTRTDQPINEVCLSQCMFNGKLMQWLPTDVWVENSDVCFLNGNQI